MGRGMNLCLLVRAYAFGEPTNTRKAVRGGSEFMRFARLLSRAAQVRILPGGLQKHRASGRPDKIESHSWNDVPVAS